jgi:glycerophosphoryl diester phosphodiesterase
VVIFHDATLSRMTGAWGRVCDYTLADLQALKIKGEHLQKVPLLSEVLALVSAHPNGRNAELHLDMKPAVCAIEVMDLLTYILTEEWSSRVFLNCWNDSYLTEAQRRLPSFKRIYLSAQPPTALSPLVVGHSINSALIRNLAPGICKAADANGQRVMAWCADTEADIECLVNIGCRYILTNYPARSKEIVVNKLGMKLSPT